MNRILAMLAVLALIGAGVWYKVKPAADTGWQGYAEADYVRVAPTLQGRLTLLTVRRGDHIDAGAPLFEQDAVSDQAARDQATAALAEARDRLRNLRLAGRDTEITAATADLADATATARRAAQDLARVAQLVPTGAATRQEMDLMQATAGSTRARVAAAAAKLAQARAPTGRAAEIAAAERQVDGAQASLAQAEWRLAQRRVAAPAGGMVVDTYALPGETIAAGAAVVEVLPPQNILVRFWVPETVLAGVHRGSRVAIACAQCPAGLAGTVSFVAPQPEYTPPVIFSRETRDKLVYLVEAHPDPAQAILLKPGQPVDVRAAP